MIVVRGIKSGSAHCVGQSLSCVGQAICVGYCLPKMAGESRVDSVVLQINIDKNRNVASALRSWPSVDNKNGLTVTVLLISQCSKNDK
jgi:hypothetical protein